METLGLSELESKVVRRLFQKAASEGRLRPVFDEQGGLDVRYAKEYGFTMQHVFVLRAIFSHRVRGLSNDEVLNFANEILLQRLHMLEIYDKLDAIIAEKKERGVY